MAKQERRERRLRLNRAAHAVADAMMVTQVNIMAEVVENPSRFLEESADKIGSLEISLKARSQDKCRIACQRVIAFLCDSYPDLFTDMTILGGAPTGRRSFAGRDWRSHDMFLVRDENGVWYAGCPANHTADNPNSPLTRIITSQDLPEVVETIKKQEGGLWPDADFIEQTLITSDCRLPQREGGQLQVLRIDRYFYRPGERNPDAEIVALRPVAEIEERLRGWPPVLRKNRKR